MIYLYWSSALVGDLCDLDSMAIALDQRVMAL